MKCEFLLTYHADLTPAVEVGCGPFGTRVFFEVKGGKRAGRAFAYASPRRRSIFSISATCISSLRIF
jgi:hypothetical protein